MTIDTSTAVALDQLADTLTATKSASTDLDAQLFNLIAPVMQVIEGRTPASGFKYTLNVTNALQLRAKKWYLKGPEEMDASSTWPVLTGFEYSPQLGWVSGGVNAFGQTLGLATSAAICRAWAEIVRRWLAGSYTTAITQPAPSAMAM